MKLVGWIVRTEDSGLFPDWKVRQVDSECAVRIGAQAAGTATAKAIAKIAAQTDPSFAVEAGLAIEIWEPRPEPEMTTRSGSASGTDMLVSERLGEITFDTVMPKEGSMYAEGCYRLAGEDLRV